MSFREFKSGKFEEVNANPMKKVDKPKDNFKGMKIKDNTSISGISSMNYEVLKGGLLRVSGKLDGDIKINGGSVRISGSYDGKIILLNGSLNISGIANGELEYIDGEIKCSGLNNLKMV